MQKALFGLLSLLLPLLFFLGSLCLSLTSLKSEFGGLAFTEDASYAQCVMATHMQDGGTPGLDPSSPAPMTRYGLSTLLLAGVAKLTGHMLTAVYLLAAVSGILTLFVVWRIARLFALDPLTSTLALMLVVCLPSTLHTSLTATGDGVFTLLISLTLLQYWKTQKRGETGLALANLFPCALAAAIHPEALVILIWMGVSGAIRQLMSTRDGANAAAAGIQVLSGVLLALACLAPIVIYHMQEFQVPWPRYADASIVVAASGQVESGTQAVETQSVSSLLLHGGALTGPWPGLLTILGLISAVTLLALRKKNSRAIDIVTLVIIPPLLASLLAPVTGLAGVMSIVLAVTPALVVLALSLCVQALSLDQVKSKLAKFRWHGRQVLTLAAGAILLIAACLGFAQQKRGWFEQLRSIQHVRTSVLGQVKDGGGAVVTDQPGWLAWSQNRRVIDVRGHYSLGVLARMDGQGRLSSSHWQNLIQMDDIKSWLIWDPASTQHLLDANVIQNLPPWSGIVLIHQGQLVLP